MRRPGRRLFDGQVRAWREVQTRSSIGGVTRSYEPASNPFPAAVQVARRSRANLGVGEEEVGQWMVYAAAPGGLVPAVESGMVLEVTAGPERGRTLRVDDPYRPRGRFQQIECRQWDGELPA